MSGPWEETKITITSW